MGQKFDGTASGSLSNGDLKLSVQLEDVTPDQSSPETLAGKLWGWLSESPQIVAASAYFWISLVGAGRAFGVLGSFGLNAFDYLTAGDLLMIGIRDPFMIVIAIATGAAATGCIAQAARSSVRKSRTWLASAVVISLVSLGGSTYEAGKYRLACVTGNCWVPSWAPLDIEVTLEKKEPTADAADVAAKLEPNLKTLKLVLSTSSYYFFYDRCTQTTVVFPRDEVKRMTNKSGRPSRGEVPCAKKAPSADTPPPQ